MVNDAYLWIIPYSQHYFLWNFVFDSSKAYLACQCKTMLYHPYSYRGTIDENPILLQRICVLSYLCLLLTKVLFETSFKSFQYNTEGRRLSNYSIKLILCSHYRSRCKGLCQNKKYGFDKYTKGGHLCAAHLALNKSSPLHDNHVLITVVCIICQNLDRNHSTSIISNGKRKSLKKGSQHIDLELYIG